MRTKGMRSSFPVNAVHHRCRRFGRRHRRQGT